MQTLQRSMNLRGNQGRAQPDAIFNFCNSAHFENITNPSSPNRQKLAPSSNEQPSSLQNHNCDHNNPDEKYYLHVKSISRDCLIPLTLSNGLTNHSSSYESMNVAQIQSLF